MDPVTERLQVYQIPYSLGILESQNMDQIAMLQKHCEESFSERKKGATETCVDLINYII